MKINFIKQPGGGLSPADDIEVEKMKKFKNFEMYEGNLKLTRNPAFLRKVMAFFGFCMQYWDGSKVLEHGSESAQFDRFRKDLTILAGYYEQTIRLNGEIRVEAKSLAFASMSEEEFQECYSALINAALKHINFNDDNAYHQLLGFF